MSDRYDPIDELFSDLSRDKPPVDEPEFTEQLQALKAEYPTVDEDSLKGELLRVHETGLSFIDAANQMRGRFAQVTVPVGQPEPQREEKSDPTDQHLEGDAPVTDVSDLFSSAVPTSLREETPEEEPAAPLEEEMSSPPQQDLPAPPKPEEPLKSAAPIMSIEDMFSQPAGRAATAAPAPIAMGQAATEAPAPIATAESMFAQQSVVVEDEMKPLLPIMPKGFKIAPVVPKKSLVIMIYSHKGDGKTTLALSLPGKIEALSFDNMTKDIHDTMYGSDPRITVWDALQEYDLSSEEAWLKSSVISLRYIDALLDEIEKRKPDWVLVDGIDKFTKMAEMAMRYNNNFSIIDGVSWQYWKYRRLYINQLHMKALRIASHGLVYTAYVGVAEKIENNKLVETTEKPKWVDVVEEESKVVIRVKSKQFEEGRRYYAIVDSSKWVPVKTGIQVDITVPFGETPDCFQRILEASEK